MVPFLQILNVYGAHSPGNLCGWFYKKQTELSNVIFTSHISMNKTSGFSLPFLAHQALCPDASKLSPYLDSLEGTGVELFDAIVPQQLPALFQSFSQALGIVSVLSDI